MAIGFLQDLKQKELMPVKMMLFLQASGDMALYPFLTLHMKSLGIGLVEIGMQFAITPLAVFVATPLIGLLADRIGNFRWMIVVSLLLSALVGQMILYVPKVQKVSVCSVEQQRFRFTCPNSIEGENERDDFFMLKVPTCFVPTSRSGSETNRMLSTGIHNIQFSQCTVVCANKTLPISLQRERPASSDSSSVWWDPPAAKLPSYCLHSEEKRVEHCLTPTWNEIKGDPSSTDTLSLNVSLSANQVRIGSRPLRASDAATNTNKNEQASVVKNNSQNPSKPDANFLSSVTNTISQVIPTPASSASASSLIVSATPGASVSLIDPNKIESKDPLPDATSSTNENVEPAPRFENAANSLPILNPPGTSATDIKRDDELHKTTESGTVNAASKKFTEILPSTLANSAQTAAAAGPITLLEGVITSIERQSAHSNDPLRHYQTIRCNSELHEDCHISCPIHADDRLPDMQQQLVDDPISHHITFWLYLLLRIMMSIIIATEMSMLKAAILTLVEKHDSEYGFQRMWASVSVAFVPLCTGILMDRLIASGDTETFSPSFYVFGSFKVLMAFICVFIDLDVKAPSVKVWSKLGLLLKRPEVVLFLFFCGLIGCVWGFIETFIAWLLEELQASRTLIGFNFTVAAIVGIPFNVYAGSFEKRFGHVPIIIFGIFVYGIRCIGYSFATEAYHVVMFEVLDGITNTLVIVVMTTYASKLSSSDLIATMQAAWAAMHFSVGRSLGSMIGGILMQMIGPSMTYMTFAMISVFFGIIYILVYVFYLRRHINDRIENEKQEKNMTVNYHINQSKIAFGMAYDVNGLGLVKGKAVSMDHQTGLNNNVDYVTNRNVYPNSGRKFSAPYSAY